MEIFVAIVIVAALVRWRLVRPPSLDDLGTVEHHRRAWRDDGRPMRKGNQ